jgi:hypothetical protein
VSVEDLGRRAEIPWAVQGRSDDQRELLDVESVAGHLIKPGSVFGFLAAHRSRLFPPELFSDLFPSVAGARAFLAR